MRFMIMMFGDAEPLLEVRSPLWIKDMLAFMRALNEELTASGELVDGRGLADSPRAKTVRLRDGDAVTTDGPVAGAKESLIGYWLLDVTDEGRAIEIAARIVEYTDVVEVRPVLDGPPQEMLDL
ncbi:MAG: YciI family protein [Actinocatenispora sp.]